MAADGELESFRTPGGHLRITRESVESARTGRKEKREAPGPSSVLRNRREHVEELALEAQELRAKRELARLKKEEREETEREEAEQEARERAAAQRQAQLEIEREHDRKERAKEAAHCNAEYQLADFRDRWADVAVTMLAAREYSWLSPGQRHEIFQALESEIERHSPDQEDRLWSILPHNLRALIEPLERERQADEIRQRVMKDALRSVPWLATEAERARATAAIRDTLRRLDDDAEECDMRVAALEAMQPLRQAIEKRLLDERLIAWAVRELPWSSNDRDEARLGRECTEILAELPANVSETEGKDALEPTISEMREEIEERQAQKQRKWQKETLIEKGVAEVSHYLWRLKQDKEISSEEYLDTNLRAKLQGIVREELESELSGKERSDEVQDLVRDIVDEELD